MLNCSFELMTISDGLQIPNQMETTLFVNLNQIVAKPC